jgi:DNA-binding NarL/FixJ family response regulator
MTVMVVDDFEPWRGFVSSRLLKQSALQIVCEIADGLEAIEKAKKLQPDLLLMDIGLPTLSGIEAADQIRQITPTSKILFVSQDGDPDLVTAALNSGGGGYVLKDDVEDELLPAITAVLRGDQFLSTGLSRNGSN